MSIYEGKRGIASFIFLGLSKNAHGVWKYMCQPLLPALNVG